MNNVRFFATTKKERFPIRENSSLLYRQDKREEHQIIRQIHSLSLYSLLLHSRHI